jgi:hypothetical protein
MQLQSAEHFANILLSYSTCRECEAIRVSAASVQPDRGLLTDRDGKGGIIFRRPRYHNIWEPLSQPFRCWKQDISFQTQLFTVRFEVFTAVTMKRAVFWDVAPCRNGVNRRFGGTYRLHLQGRREIIRWRRYVSPKSRLTPFLHGATSQKTALFTVIYCFRHACCLTVPGKVSWIQTE